jgi:molybdopterin molybdotransferase
LTGLGRDLDDYSSVGEALTSVLGGLRARRKVETIRTSESYGRVPAHGLTSPRDVPAFATSHMDGFAVISDDLIGASVSSPVHLKVTGSGKLGGAFTPPIEHGEAMRVATGGRLPRKADAVLPIEDAEERDGILLVDSASKRGDHVYPAGGDIAAGETILSAGQPIRAQDIGLLLSLGYSTVRVWRRPTVSVIATGSELTDSEKPSKGEVRNSHAPILLRLCEAQGCRALDQGVVPDDERKIRRAISGALTKSDFVITLGGTSIGRHDVVGEALNSLRPLVMAHGLKMDRGRVTGVAVVRGKPVLMAPGPIQGALNAFILLGIPIIRYLAGTKQREVLVRCTMGQGWTARKRFADFQKVLYVKLVPGEEAIAEPLLGETESMKVLTQADGYVWVREGVNQIAKGTKVTVRLIPGFSFP